MKKLTMSKKLIIYIFLSCSLIQLLTFVFMWRMLDVVLITGGSFDFSPLTALIGSVVGEAISYGVYAVKSLKENTEGGVIYDLAMKNFEASQEEKENDGSVG